MADKWRIFLELCGEVVDLQQLVALASWDRHVTMPAGGAEDRAAQMATLSKHVHRLVANRRFGELLAELEAEKADAPPGSAVAGILRVARRQHDLATKLPAPLVAELAKVSSLALSSWIQAKQARDFALFQPHLTRLVELQRARAEALGYADTPYDALLDAYEPGLRTAEVTKIFAELRAHLALLANRIAARAHLVDDGILRQYYPDADQWKLCRKACEFLGLSAPDSRLDRSEHPFTVALSPRDVRITINTVPNFLGQALFATLHEAGHALYEQGIPWNIRRTPLAMVESLSLHESQSRLWENVIGRSRLFWQSFLPVVRGIFPAQLAGVGVDRVYRAVNKVAAGTIRVNADEVTYNLHILVRFEIEKALFAGEVAVPDLPELWRGKMREYLGVAPADDAEGVLQDVHWSQGSFGYFPTYTLGTVLAAQLWEAMHKEEPGLGKELTAGRFTVVKRWLAGHIYAAGAGATMPELTQKATGRPLQTGPYLRYLEGKYQEIYGT